MLQSSQKGQTLILLIVLVLIVGAGFLAGGFVYPKPKDPLPNSDTLSDKEVMKKAPTSNEGLQLDPINFCKRVPGDEPKCYPRNAGFCCPNENWAKVICKDSKCAGVEQDGPGQFVEEYAAKAGMTACEWLKNPVNYPDPKGHVGFPIDEWCASDSCKNMPDGLLCWGKPVILLYPEKPTLVDVEVATSGEIYVSDPLYPVGGWKNVLANPDGSLVYQNKPYSELFYESKVKNYGIPPTGLIIKTSELETELPRLLFELGLNYNKNEIPEFMDFWLPKLKALNSKYVFVSLIPPDVKEKNDNVTINPEPDTRIELIVYFKPLDNPIKIESLNIGPRPVRRGFTMIEWGGTIDPSGQTTDN